MNTRDFLAERTQAVTEWIVTDLWPELRGHMKEALAAFWSETAKPAVDLFFDLDGEESKEGSEEEDGSEEDS